MKLLYGFIFLITGCAGTFASCRQLYRIIRLKLFGNTCTAKIVDFYEGRYRNYKLHSKDLIERAGISYAIIAKLEKGDNVQMEVLEKICRAFKCQLSDIAEIDF